MKSLKKYLLAFVLLFVAFLVVGCGETPADEPDPEPEGPTEVKISEISVYPTIYDGEEDAPYVLVDQEIYFEAELNDGATEVEKWSIDDTSIATLTVNEEGGVICKGLKAGNATVTASNEDGTIKASKTFEVAISKDTTEILVAANDEIIAAFPKYIAANTKLPVPANPNVTIKYTNSITNGIKVVNGEYQYAYEDSKGDVNKSINFTLTYHGDVLKCTTYFYEVKDANDNLFTCVDKVAAKINETFADYIKAEDKTLVSENLVLPASYTAEEVGRDVQLAWTSDKTTTIADDGTYTKATVDTAVVLTATISIKNGEDSYAPVSKHAITVTAAGYTPEEVIEYFQSKKYCPVDNYATTSSSVTIQSTDASKKFKGLTVEWKAEGDNADKVNFKQANKAIFLAKGEFTLVGTFYYNKQILASYFATQDTTLNAEKTYYTFDVETQTYNAVATPVEADLANYFEMTETLTYAWMREVTIHITRN